MFTGELWAWRWDFLAIVKTPINHHFQRVLGFEKRLLLICTRSQALGQIAERNDELARAIGLKTRGIFKCHNDPLFFHRASLRNSLPLNRTIQNPRFSQPHD